MQIRYYRIAYSSAILYHNCILSISYGLPGQYHEFKVILSQLSTENKTGRFIDKLCKHKEKPIETSLKIGERITSRRVHTRCGLRFNTNREPQNMV
jgi:hypothetical protein